MSNLVKDPADDGMEITIIRTVTGRTEDFYRNAIEIATQIRNAEAAHIIHVECDFARKVGTL